MRKKQIDTSLMDGIEFGLSIGYLKKIDTYVTHNSESTITAHDYTLRYKEYCR